VRLSRVEIKGFKSLSKKTVLTFPGAVTCIAGPNGCGKSNVIDAIRWALGEQSARAMRAGSMADVIFSGTRDVPASAMASVTLEFVKDGGTFPASMDGFEAISVSRRLFRSGESTYEINNLRCRLKDITDIFLDSGLDRQGYAIIEQGRVKDIILAKPEDIRHVIEEVAEVGRFRVKRSEAIKRLETTSGNLERIKDIITEVAKQRDSLKTQASKARRYQSLKDRMNELTRLLWSNEIREVLNKHQELNAQLISVEDEIKVAKSAAAKEAAMYDKQSNKLNQMKVRIDELNSSLSDAKARHALAIAERSASIERMKDLQSTLLHLNSKIEAAGAESEVSVNELKSANDQKSRIEQDVARIEATQILLSDDVDKLSAELSEASSEYDRSRSELFEKLGSSRLIDQRINYLNQRLSDMTSGISKSQEDLIELKAVIREQNNILVKHEAMIKGLDEKIRTGNEEILEISKKRDLLSDEIEENRYALSEKEKVHAGMNARIEMLGRIASRSPHSPENSGGKTLIRVADTIKVKAGYEDAAGALGDMLDYMIIKDHDDFIASGINIASSPGFIPSKPYIEKEEPEEMPANESMLGSLRNFINPKKGFEAITDTITRRKYIVRDLGSAVKLWKKGQRSHDYITADGIVLETSGVLRVNTEKDKYAEMFKARAELEVQNLNRAGLETEMQKVRDAMTSLGDKLSGFNAEIINVNERLSDLEKERHSEILSKQSLQGRIEVNDKRVLDFLKDIKSWDEMTSGVKAEIKTALEEKDSAENLLSDLKEQLKRLETKKLEASAVLEKAQEKKNEIMESLGRLRVEMASVLERIKGLTTQSQKRQVELEADMQRAAEITVKEKEITSMLENAEEVVINSLADIKAKEVELEDIMPEYTRFSDEAGEISEREHALKSGLFALEDKKNMIILEAKEQEIAERMMLERYAGRFGKDALPEIPDDFDIESSREEVAKLQGRVEVLGQINFASIESYEETQARYDDFHAQYQDLVLASVRLKELISSIERESQKEFAATFARVRANFQEIFTTMFGGGQADIVLHEGGMDAGVDIYACPPFKKLKVMSLLSEGEKTLTAISFIFALFKVRPSPFCILDEVDAPLDDSNVERINRLIRAFSKDSQFLVVTHNKNTLEMADIIYGVTFDVPGITKVVSMDLQKV
jgi:chromosome segregation protein